MSHIDAPENVAAAFAKLPENVQPILWDIRQLIFEVADTLDNVSPLIETLKWGEPAYLPKVSGIGTTIRLGCSRHYPNKACMFFNCRTQLVDDFRNQFPDEFYYEGNRGVILKQNQCEPKGAIEFCISAALTYHQRKK